MSMFALLLVIWLMCMLAMSEEEEETKRAPTIPKLENKIYKNGENDVVEFIDINGLNEVIEFEMELIGSGFTFLEGPRWIPTLSGSSESGYILFTELITHTIWKYDEDNKENPFEAVVVFDELKCGPTGIAWNKKFADELWIACFLSGDILKLDSSTYEIVKQYDYTNFMKNVGIKFMVDDIIIDSKGNIYFTDMPIPPMRVCGAYHRGGTFMISRDNFDEIQLIELLDFGPNGIALKKDESLFTVSNSIDVPLDRDYIGKTDYDHSKIYIRGYTLNHNKILPFMYFDPNEQSFHDYFAYQDQFNYVFDSSGFDYHGNMWQAVFLIDANDNENKGGQASVFTNVNGTSKYIGTIRVHDTELQFDNFEVGGDGYMYATGGDVYALKGTLSRIKLKKAQPQGQKYEL